MPVNPYDISITDMPFFLSHTNLTSGNTIGTNVHHYLSRIDIHLLLAMEMNLDT